MKEGRDDVALKIATLLIDSGLSFDDQVKAISMARVAIQPRMSETDWRSKSKPILKPKEKTKKADTEQ
jgi:hypothetical protein